MRHKPFKDVVILPGHYYLRDTGEKVPGLDLSRYIRDILFQCNIDCYNCNDNPCGEQSKLSTITELQAEIEALKARLIAAGI